MPITRRTCLGAIGAAVGAGVLSRRTFAQVKPLPGLPSTMIWSVGDDGGPRYREAQAIADALSKMHGTRVRLQPSERSFGRMEQLKERQVTHGWLGTEAYFAAEGMYAYAAPNWGPQDLRCLLGRMSSMSIVTMLASGIKTLGDIKGKRFGLVPTNTSLNVKIEAMLEAAGLGYKDLSIVEFTSSAEALTALLDGRVDCVGAVPLATSAQTLLARADDIRWIELPSSDRDLWSRIQRVLPLALPFVEELGPGISKQNPKSLLGYRDPVVAVYADANDLDVHAVTKAIVENFDLYRTAAPVLDRWELPGAAGYPTALPFHDGAIKLLKEKKVWTPDHQRWQDNILKRRAALRQGWADMMAKDPAAKDADAAKLSELWMQRRTEVLKSL